MPIKIMQDGTLWTAEVTSPEGQWQSPRPMAIGHLIEVLKSIGCQQTDIDHALQEAAAIQSQRYWDSEIGAKLGAALAGECDVPPQQPFTEAWLAYALFLGDSLLSLKDVVDIADSINHALPNTDEIAWAFLRLRKRGWLAEQGGQYGLTAEGRRAIGDIVSKGNVLDQVEQLKEWTLAHPPPAIG